MRSVLFVVGIAIILLGVFAAPYFAGDSFQWWMSFIPGMVGGAVATSAFTA